MTLFLASRSGFFKTTATIAVVLGGSFLPSSVASERGQTIIKMKDMRPAVLPLSTNSITDAQDAQHWGTAFAVGNTRTLVTADHVVRDLSQLIQSRSPVEPREFLTVLVKEGGLQPSYTSVPVEIVTENRDLDLAILKFTTPMSSKASPTELDSLEIDADSEMEPGDPVDIMGYPLLSPYSSDEFARFQPSELPALILSFRLAVVVTPAHIAGSTRVLNSAQQDPRGHITTKQQLLILDHPAAPGNSGGPVVSGHTGKVVGVVVRTNAFGYSFAVSAHDLSQVVKEH
jgi:S1-C subfamily serine protease